MFLEVEQKRVLSKSLPKEYDETAKLVITFKHTYSEAVF